MLGLNFDHCNPFLLAFEFEQCQLNWAIFQEMSLKQTLFKGCSLQEADFTLADLTGAQFTDCDLYRATFVQCNLEKTDFRTAIRYSIDPEQNNINKARFSTTGLAGLLEKYNIEVE